MDPPNRLFVVPPLKISYETISPEYKKTISRFIGLMKFIGIDIFGAKLGPSNVNASVRMFIYCFSFIPFTIFTYGLALHLDQFEDPLRAATIPPTVILFSLDIIKLAAVMLKRKEVKELLLEIGELWPTQLANGDKKTMMMSWLRKTTLIVTIFFGYTTVNMFHYFSVPVFHTFYNLYSGVNEYILPFEPPGPWIINSTSVYLASYAWEALLMPGQVCLYQSYDILIIMSTFNVSLLFRVLQFDLKDAIQASCATRKNMKVLDEDFDKIKNAVITHQKILSLVEKLNNCFGFVIFTHNALSALIICFFFFMIVANTGTELTIICIFASIDMSMTVFLLALAGQLLYDTSSGVAEAVYDSNWYESDLKVQKLVLFIIVRSQQPCFLEAMSFGTLTLATFSKIISTAWSYLSLLTQMYGRH